MGAGPTLLTGRNEMEEHKAPDHEICGILVHRSAVSKPEYTVAHSRALLPQSVAFSVEIGNACRLTQPEVSMALSTPPAEESCRPWARPPAAARRGRHPTTIPD